MDKRVQVADLTVGFVGAPGYLCLAVGFDLVGEALASKRDKWSVCHGVNYIM